LLPVASGTAFVNPEHNQEVKLGFRADAWEPSVRVGTLAWGGEGYIHNDQAKGPTRPAPRFHLFGHLSRELKSTCTRA